jgi:hypothetical protein
LAPQRPPSNAPTATGAAAAAASSAEATAAGEDKEAAFTRFRGGDGSVLEAALRQARVELGEAKKRAGERAQTVNAAKAVIDRLAQAEPMGASSGVGGKGSGEPPQERCPLPKPSNEDMKTAKRRYRDAFAELGAAKEELEVRQSEKDAHMAALVSGFESWLLARSLRSCD